MTGDWQINWKFLLKIRSPRFPRATVTARPVASTPKSLAAGFSDPIAAKSPKANYGGLRDRSPEGRGGRSAAVAVVIGRHAQAPGRRGRIQRLLVPLLVQLLRRARRRRCPRRAASSCARRAAPLGSGHVAPPLDLFLRGKDPISVQCLACGGAPKSTRSGCWLCSASLLCRCVPLTADSSGKSLSSPLTRRAVVHVKFTSITGDGGAPRANKASDDKLKTPAGDRLRASCRSPYNSGFGNQVASYCGSRRPLRTSAG